MPFIGINRLIEATKNNGQTRFPISSVIIKILLIMEHVFRFTLIVKKPGFEGVK